MKRKMVRQIESREILRSSDQQAQAEIKNFLLAVDSYPDQAAKEPGLSFHQHLCSFFVANRDDRQDLRSRRQ